MYKIVDGRGTGKTSKLIKMAKENNYTIVTKDVSKMVKHMYDLNITGVKIISYNEFFNQSAYNENYVVNKLDEFIASTEFGKKLQGYTLTID